MNNRIYLVIEQYGSAYAMVEGELTQFPMSANGKIQPDERCAVEFDCIEEDEALKLRVVEAMLISLASTFKSEVAT